MFASIPSQIWFERTLPRKAFLASDFNGGTAKIIHLTVGSSSRWTAVVPVHLPLPTRPLKLLSISWTRLALAGSLQAHSATPEQAVERLPSARGSSVCPLGPGSPPRLAQSVSRIALRPPRPPQKQFAFWSMGLLSRMPWLFPARPRLPTLGCDLPCYKVRET